MKKNEKEIIQYINELKDYEGYVQFSHRPIDREKDIFPRSEDIDANDVRDGFIYEAHFYNSKDSITIKQVNNSWLVDKIENTPLDDTQIYLSDIKEFNYKIKMAQIWKAKEDDLCAGMKVKKLKKVVFVGFVKGESK
ncbi:MAG: TIGR04423 family type III CRISPR-associated protein [Campylobacterota bacterium]|nr:TIGR04423 family type III CRISPR-associated protein [Campylobacterota bacterium]